MSFKKGKLPLETYHAFAVKLAMQAGRIMRRHFVSASDSFLIKSDQTPLTVADTSINSMVIRAVARSFADHSVLGEEESSEHLNEQLWVCDPIDGTFPFSHGVPTSTFNLAYVHDGEPLVSVTYDPFQKRLYSAIRGQGAWLGERRLNLRKIKPRGRSIVSSEVGNWEGSVLTDPQSGPGVMAGILALGQLPIYLCSVAYSSMLVASGECNGVLFSGKNPWDGAAVGLIVEEAGGLMTDLRGHKQRYDRETFGFIAARPEWHPQLVKLVAPFIRNTGDQ